MVRRVLIVMLIVFCTLLICCFLDYLSIRTSKVLFLPAEEISSAKGELREESGVSNVHSAHTFAWFQRKTIRKKVRELRSLGEPPWEWRKISVSRMCSFCTRFCLRIQFSQKENERLLRVRKSCTFDERLIHKIPSLGTWFANRKF